MSATILHLLAPAKLNLFLHITGRRADGYHTLQTLFQLLDYGDPMSFQLDASGSDSLHLQSSGLGSTVPVPLERNLIMRAVSTLRQLAGSALPGVRITLDKQIPVGGGLGGGSANAAMTLLALNELWKLELDRSELCRIGVQLGADVPVFIRGDSAWAEGIGEVLEPVTLPPAWYVVITPPCLVSTSQVFSHSDLTRNTPAIKMADFLAGLVRNDCHNDCEAVTCRLYPEVAATLKWLGGFAEARMTGTGASAFASFDDADSARKVLRAKPVEWHGFVAQGVNNLSLNTLALNTLPVNK